MLLQRVLCTMKDEIRSLYLILLSYPDSDSTAQDIVSNWHKMRRLVEETIDVHITRPKWIDMLIQYGLTKAEIKNLDTEP